MNKIKNEQVYGQVIEKFDVPKNMRGSLKTDFNALMNSVENMVENKNENEFNKLNSALNCYGITVNGFVSIMKCFAEDESILKFNELEKEGWYKLNSMIENSDLSDDEKIKHMKDSCKMNSEESRKKENKQLAKFFIGVVGAGAVFINALDRISGMTDSESTKKFKIFIGLLQKK